MDEVPEQPVLTPARVFEICARHMAAQGREPTLAEIRAAAGGGSDRDAVRYRNDWRKAEAEKLQVATALPPEVTLSMQNAARDIWLQALKNANSLLLRAQKEHEEAMRQAIADSEEMLSLIARKDDAIAATKADLDRAQGQAQEAVREAERHKGALHKQAEIAKRQDDELARLRDELVQERRQNQSIQNELAAHLRAKSVRKHGADLRS